MDEATKHVPLVDPWPLHLWWLTVAVVVIETLTVNITISLFFFHLFFIMQEKKRRARLHQQRSKQHVIEASAVEVAVVVIETITINITISPFFYFFLFQLFFSSVLFSAGKEQEKNDSRLGNLSSVSLRFSWLRSLKRDWFSEVVGLISLLAGGYSCSVPSSICFLAAGSAFPWEKA